MRIARKQKVIDKDALMNALDMLDEQYVTINTVDDIIEDLEEDAIMASAEHDGADYYGGVGYGSVSSNWDYSGCFADLCNVHSPYRFHDRARGR